MPSFLDEMAFERLYVRNYCLKIQKLETMRTVDLVLKTDPLTSSSLWSLAEGEAGQGDAGGLCPGARPWGGAAVCFFLSVAPSCQRGGGGLRCAFPFG